jgi:hypothetical protein
MMARRLMVISGVGLAISAYFIFIRDRDDMVYLLIVSLLVLVLTYTFQHQINQLMIRGVPQRLDTDMRAMLLATSPHFNRLTELQQRMAEDRMQRWVMQKEFINKNEQDAPEDVKYILAWYAILLTLHQEDYLFKGIDRIVFYHHPFLSPHYQDDVHILEVEPQDGTIIISVPHLIRGHMEKGVYNVGIHAIAEAYAHCYLREEITWSPGIWEKLEAISTIPRDSIESYIGLKQLDPWAVAVHHQMTYSGAGISEVQERIPSLNVGEQ